jgi:diguanylate cyclase (GGDEF)-like protein
VEEATAPSLLAAIHILAREGTLDARLHAFAREARTVAGGGGAVILLRDVEGGTFATPLGGPLELDGAGVATLRDAAEERRATWSATLPSGIAALVGDDRGCILPLVNASAAGAQVQGVLVVGGGDTAADATRDALGALAELAAVAIEQERLRTALEERGAWHDRVARTDPLTGLADRATFIQMLELEVLRATRQGTALAVVLVAVDDLEPITTAEGGRLADDILRVVAATLADGLRLVDTIARLGPDELGVIAPGDPSGTVASRVLAAVASLPDIGGVTARVRAGVAHHPADGTDAAELLRAAQGALTEARAGSPGTIIGLRAGFDAGVAPIS